MIGSSMAASTTWGRKLGQINARHNSRCLTLSLVLEALAFDSGRTEVAMSEIQLCNWEDNKSQKAATTAVEVFKQYNLCILTDLKCWRDHREKLKVFIKMNFTTAPTYCYSSMSMSPNPLRQLHVFWHDSHPLSMNCTEVGVLKQPYNISLHPLLESREGCCLDAEGGGILQHQTPGKSLERKATY